MPINVLHLRSSGGFFGAEKNILTTAQILKNLSINSCIACIDYNNKKNNVELLSRARQLGIDTVSIEGKRRLDLSLIDKVASVIKDKRISVIETHGYKENFFGYFAAKKAGIRAIANIHGWTGHRLTVRAYEFLDLILLRLFDKIIVISSAQREKLKKAGVSEAKIALVHNCIDLDTLPQQANGKGVRERFGIANSDILVGAVGRLSPEKGYANLIETIAGLRKQRNDLKLMIVGDGPQRDHLLRIGQRLRIADHIIFPGHQRDIYDYYTAFDIFALSSLTEGFPNVILEALAYRKPVIATNVGAVNEVIKHKVTGYLVHPDNAGELADGIRFILENKDAAQKMADTGYELVKKKFSKSNKASQLESIYHSVVQ